MALSPAAHYAHPVNEKTAEADRGRDTQSNTLPPRPTFDRVESEYEKTPCQEGKDNRWSDLCAQWKAADAANSAANWTKWATGIAGAGLLGVVFTVFFSYQAAKTAKEDLNNTIKSQRPFLIPVAPELRKLNSSINDCFGVFFSIANHGSEIGILQDIKSTVTVEAMRNFHASGVDRITKDYTIPIVNAVSTSADFKYHLPIIDLIIPNQTYRQIENFNVALIATIVFRYSSVSKRRWKTIYEMEFSPHFGTGGGDLQVRPNGWTDRELKPDEN